MQCEIKDKNYQINVFIFLVIKKTIELRRYERYSFEHILNGFKVNQCEWLKTTSSPHVSLAVYNIRFEILKEFLDWFAAGFVVPLIKVKKYI